MNLYNSDPQTSQKVIVSDSYSCHCKHNEMWVF